MVNFSELIQKTYFNNPISNYLGAFLTLVIGLLITRIVIRRILICWFTKKVKSTAAQWDDVVCDMIKKTIVPLCELFVVYVSLQCIEFTPTFSIWVNRLFFLFAVVIITKSTSSFIKNWIYHLLKKQYSTSSSHENFKGLIQIITVFVWIISSLIVLDYFGVDVTALIASVGILGLAGAMAARGIVEDIICYFTIILDKPFEVGDFISFSNQSGTLKSIGLASSRIQSLSGEEIVLSNSQLINNLIQNFKKMEERRTSFSIGILYETSSALVKEVPTIIQSIIEEKTNVRFGRCHFKNFGDFSLNFETVYYVLNNDYDEYMSIQQSINISIFESFEEKGIGFAYPTQLVYTKPQSTE
ncbi:MAG: mechanosensitive ion channel family protein [Caldisericia bacterium]|nr:mechanosensitive ion channel family protein [Caldisericia bacterium]